MSLNIFDQLIDIVSTQSYVDVFNLVLKQTDLRNPAVLGKVRMLVRQNLAPSDAQEVLDRLLPVLNSDRTLATVAPELYKGWQQVVTYLHFIALLFIKNPDEVEDLFKNHLLFALRENVDLQATVDVYLTLLRDEFTGSEHRRLLIESLKKNEEKLGDQVREMRITGNKEPVSPMIKNWLTDYELMEGKSYEPRSALQQGHYLVESKNVSMLDDEEKSLLMKIIKLYDYLCFVPALLPSDKLVIEGKLLEKITPDSQAPIQKLVLGEEEVLTIPPPQPLSNVPTAVTKIKPTPLAPVSRAIPPIIEVLRPTIMPPLKSVPQALKTTEPAFLFDEADEREADRFRIKNQELGIKKTLEKELRNLAEEVIEEHNFSFKDEVSHKRFVQLFVSFLKDVRDVIEAREMLLRNTDSGGLGLTSEKAEKVIEILQQTKKEFESRIKNQELGIEEKNGILRPASGGTQNDVIHKPKTELDKMIEADRYRISNDEFLISKKNLEIEKPEIAPPKSSLGPAMTRGPEPKITPPTPSDAAKAQILRQQILEQIVSKIEADKTAPLPPPEPLARPKLVDVKAPPRVLGPLEELRTLSVVDFRRLADNPVEALNKINKKIDIVGEASVGKRVEAVRAWQASPVYQLYLKIGRASIETGQSVADIIAEQAQKNETTLSEDEFNAVADFNERIRF